MIVLLAPRTHLFFSPAISTNPDERDKCLSQLIFL